MSKSAELLASSEDVQAVEEETHLEDCTRMNLSGSRQLSRSATELRESPKNEKNSTVGHYPEHRRICIGVNEMVQHIRQQHRHISVAQRTHTFFAALKSRWSRSRSKECKKCMDVTLLDLQGKSSNNQESDYAADYSSEHSRSSSVTYSPARHYLNHFESPLVQIKSNDKSVILQDGSSGRCSDNSLKFQQPCTPLVSENAYVNDLAKPIEQTVNNSEDVSSSIVENENIRLRELALRQHAFFQLRLHILRGANLVAMDRCEIWR